MPSDVLNKEDTSDAKRLQGVHKGQQCTKKLPAVQRGYMQGGL
jgi:hypothetical protein